MSAQDTVKQISKLLDEVVAKTKGVSKAEAQSVVNDLQSIYTEVEDTLAAIGVEHQLYISLGDYGSGRHLCLKDVDYGWGESFSAGEWIPSSATC